MTDDPATPPPASDFAPAHPPGEGDGPGHGPFLPADDPNWLLLWTLHTPDSWARAITIELLRKAQSSVHFETGAVVGVTRIDSRLWVRLQFRGEDGELGEEFKLTI
jgi:hypothetical protein